MRHPVERHLDDSGLAPREQKLERRRRGELGSAAETAATRVGGRPKARDRRIEQRRGGLIGRRVDLGHRAEPLANPRRGLRDALALGFPGSGDRLQDHSEARHPIRRRRREVGAAVEGNAVRVAEDRERPAALAGHALDRLHVDRIHVRALLPVDLHADEAVVHVGGRRVVLERLALHHVAPMAGRVADRHQDRAIGLPRKLASGGAPRVPVDGVVLVLEEVGAGLGGEGVGHRFEATQL